MRRPLGKIPVQPILFLLFFPLFLPCSSSAQAPPNVLFILTDDLGWGDLHCHGNDSVSTPNIDRLAQEGVQFDRFYVSPAGASTRASLLTGRYALRTGVSGEAHRRQVMRANETTIAEIFRAAGYRTALFGKWENGAQYPNDPKGQGFDEFSGFYGAGPFRYFDTTMIRNSDSIRAPGFATDVLTDSAIHFITENKTLPFFCFLAYNTPGGFLNYPDFYFDQYKKAGKTDKNAAAYGAIENIDDNVGRLLGTLDSLGIRDNTYVVFLSDNGPDGERYTDGLRGQKSSLYEGSIRVPCIIQRSNYLAPRQMSYPVADIDLLPTIAGLCELSLPAAVQPDGINFSRIMQGAPDLSGDRLLFFQFSDGKVSPYPGAVVAGRFSFILDKNGHSELYNIKNDPAQTRNLADSLTNVASIMKSKYLDWYADVTRAGTEPLPIPVDRRMEALTWLPVSDRDTTESRHPTDRIIDPNDSQVQQDVWLDDRDSVIRWIVEVQERGLYQIDMQYSRDSVFAGKTVVLVTNGSEIRITVDAPTLPPAGKTAGHKEWKTVRGVIEMFEPGVQVIRLYLPYVGKDEIAINGLVLKRL